MYRDVPFRTGWGQSGDKNRKYDLVKHIRVGGAQPLHVYADLAVDVVHFALLLSFRSQSG